MEDTEWLCSALTNCFYPLFRPYQASGPSAESFDKSGPRQLHTQSRRYSSNKLHDYSIILYQPKIRIMNFTSRGKIEYTLSRRTICSTAILGDSPPISEAINAISLAPPGEAANIAVT